MDPQHQEIWLDYSDVYTRISNYEAAIQVIKTGLSYQHQSADLYYRLSVYQILSGKNQEAFSSLQSGLALNYDAHQKIFKYHPNLKQNTSLITFIEAFREDI